MSDTRTDIYDEAMDESRMEAGGEKIFQNKCSKCGHDHFVNVSKHTSRNGEGEWESTEIEASCAKCGEGFWTEIN